MPKCIHKARIECQSASTTGVAKVHPLSRISYQGEAQHALNADECAAAQPAPAPARLRAADISALIARARTRDEVAIEALAQLVETRLLRALPQRRGGDPQAAARTRRDEALRRLATVIGADMPAERLARDLGARLARYRPTPAETVPERLLMREIVATGLPVPGPDRLARILRGR
jgi:hypothetical protein